MADDRIPVEGDDTISDVTDRVEAEAQSARETLESDQASGSEKLAAAERLLRDGLLAGALDSTDSNEFPNQNASFLPSAFPTEFRREDEPGLLEKAGREPDLSNVGGAPPNAPPVQDGPGGGGPPQQPVVVRLSRPDDGQTQDTNLWTLIRNRTDAVSFNNYFRYIDAIICREDTALATAPGLRQQANELAFLGLDGYHVLRTATEYFLQQEVGLVVEPERDNDAKLTRRQALYDQAMGIRPPGEGDPGTDPTRTTEYRRRNFSRLPENWLTDMRDGFLTELKGSTDPRVLPYLGQIMSRLRDLPLKEIAEVPAGCYGVLPSRLIGPLGLELIWSYWHEEGMMVQAFNSITNRFQNLRTPNRLGGDPFSRLEIDPLRRLNNFLWGWIQNQPFLLTVRRRAYEYDHHYGITLLGAAAGPVDGADSRSQFISAFHNLLHACTIFYQQDDDLTVHADGFPLLNALRETQLVLTAGAHNQYGDLPWTARVEMLMQMWMLARPEMREFLGGRVMVPYKEPWMDRVDVVKSLMDWSDVNVTHFRDLGTFGEQILLSIRYGSWAAVIEPAHAVNWARYWRPEIQGYVHAYRAATGADLRQNVDVTMPGLLLQERFGQVAQRAGAASPSLQPAARRPALASRGARGALLPSSGADRASAALGAHAVPPLPR